MTPDPSTITVDREWLEAVLSDVEMDHPYNGRWVYKCRGCGCTWPCGDPPVPRHYDTCPLYQEEKP